MTGDLNHADAALTPGDSHVHRLGCVSFLNALPLIDGLDELDRAAGRDAVELHFDVPSRLLPDLEAGRVDMALCPVIDLHKSKVQLQVVPCGGIGCHGKTLTVRLFSRIPIEQIESVGCDTDSHTSVVLMQILLWQCFGVRPKVTDYQASVTTQPSMDAMLLIGDKVVTSPPDDKVYAHQVDLGECWKQVTGLPFVFAVWMARRDADLGDLPARLDQIRQINTADEDRLFRMIDKHAPKHGWPADLARKYLGQWLRYDIGAEQLQAMTLFASKAHELGLIDACKPIQVYQFTPADHSTA